MNSKGFTLTELIIASAIGSIVILGAGYLASQVNQQMSANVRIVDAYSSRQITDSVLYADLKGATPSFNVLRLPKDGTISFYDYMGTTPCIPGDYEGGCTRKFCLESPGAAAEPPSPRCEGAVKGNEFYVLKIDPLQVGKIKRFDPSGLYNHTDTSIQLSMLALARTLGTDQHGLWHSDNLLLFQAPVYSDRPGTTDTRHLPPISNYFLGTVQGSNLKPFSYPNLSYWDVQPSCLNDFSGNGHEVTVNNVDAFMRCIPTFGGLAASIDVFPVRLVKYYFDVDTKNSQPNAYRLVRTEIGPDGNEVHSSKNLPYFSQDIKRIVLMRPEGIESPEISYKFEYLLEPSAKEKADAHQSEAKTNQSGQGRGRGTDRGRQYKGVTP